MSEYDAAKMYEYSRFVSALTIAQSKGDVLAWEREHVERALADYPGVLVWDDERHDKRGVFIHATKYPPDIAARILAKRAASAPAERTAPD